MAENVIKVTAEVSNLPVIIEFVEKQLERTNCSMKTITELELITEEIFTNISNYAYSPEKGMAEIKVNISDENPEIILSFEDFGRKFNPLEKSDPDTGLSLEEREIGGLGIFLVKKYSDNVTYKYEDNRNILIIRKRLN